ncbi:hypothetical protein HY971_02605 [Candidatus Kaiserbacteria bacterium]|nr:hypothetical protein [Candidatus Kaiserbacteria bacterium]
MVFHESLNRERKFSLVTPLVFVAILGGVTGVVEVANSFSSASSYAFAPQAQLAQSAASTPSDPKEADKECPKEDTTHKYGTKAKGPTYQEGSYVKVIITNLSWKKCQHTEDTDIAAQGYCIAENICHADICDEKQCTLTKGPTDDAGTGEPPKVPSNADEIQKLRDQAAAYDALAKDQKDAYTQLDAVCMAGQSGCDQEAIRNAYSAYTSNEALRDKALKEATALEQIQAYGNDPTAPIPSDYQGENPWAIDKALGENAVKLTPEQAAEYANLKDAFGPTTPGVNDTFGPAATPEELRRAELENTIRSDQAAWAGANNQAALEETIRSDQAAWAEADKQIALERDARIQELENEKAIANAGAGENFPEAKQEELDRLQAQKLKDEQGSSPPQKTDASPSGPSTPKSGDKADAGEKNTPPKSGDKADSVDKKTPQMTDAFGTPCGSPGSDASTCPKSGPAPKPGAKTDVPKPEVKPEVKKGDGTPDAKPEVKTPTPPAGPGAGPGTGGEKPGGDKPGGGGGDIGKALSSMLEGLMKALGAPQSPPAAPAQACSTDQNVYAQQQQQYQQQLQQYNYQLQQQQYQQQMNQFYAERNGGITPPDLPLPQRPTPCSPSTGNQCRDQVPQPNPNNCTTGSWQPTYSGACITNWQCIPTGGGAPKATLSCSPEVADVGQQIAITYGCSSGIASSSSFTITTQPGGSATTTVQNPPAGTNTATYSLACVDGAKTSGAQCSVQVSRPTIILVANPATVTAASSTSLISWLTTGMDSCVISSPDMPGFTIQNMSNTSVAGAATTTPLTSAARIHLECQTLAGGTKGATTTVHVAGVPDNFAGGLVEASSTIDGATVPLGTTTTIAWRTINPPPGSAISLWLVDVQGGEVVGLIAGGKATSGSYDWHVPNAGDACPSGTPYVCDTDLVSGRDYMIEADLYTPADANLGEPNTPPSAPDPLYLEFGFTDPFTMR